MSAVDSKQTRAETQMHENALASLRTVILMWSKQIVKSSKPLSNYKNRLIVNFQPGMTPRYLKYLLTSYNDLKGLEDKVNILDEQEQQAVREFVERFVDRTKNIMLLDKNSLQVNNTTPGIILLHVDDLRDESRSTELGKFILEHIAGLHCLLVFSKPICGVNYKAIEKRFGVKVRPLWLPSLTVPNSDGTDYQFSTEYINKCYGIPLVMEMHSEQTHEATLNKKTLKIMALWQLPEFKPHLGHFYSLFSFARSGTQLYTSSKLSAELYTLNTATVLGFTVLQAGANRKNSGGKVKDVAPLLQRQILSTPPRGNNNAMPLLVPQKPYSVHTLNLLANKFDEEHADFDVFKLIHGNSLKWYEAERAVARAIVEGSLLRKKFGEQWPFFRGTFLADVRAELVLRPQVTPKVVSNGSTLNIATLNAWAKGNREAPPQYTMNSQQWAKLSLHLEQHRAIIPVERSRSPDVMFLIRLDKHRILLCFQVKTGVQDLTLPHIQAEISKTPFLGLLPSGEIVRLGNDRDLKITFIYVAPVHSAIKQALLNEAVECNINLPPSPVVLHNEFIHVKPGSKTLVLPQGVEVIILLKLGLEALFGEDYNTLLDAHCDTKALAEEERMCAALKTIELPKNAEQVRQLTKELIEMVKHVPDAGNIIKETVDKELRRK